MRKFITLLLSLLPFMAFAQLDAFDHYVRSVSDASKFLNGYFGPFGQAFSNGLNSNWYQSGKSLRWGTISGNIGLSYIQIPKYDQTFNIAEQNFQSLKDVGTDHDLPTIFGPTNLNNKLEYYIIDDSSGYYKVINTFQGIKGSGVNFLLVPIVQLDAGLPLNTQLSVRYVPAIGFTGADVYASVELWGLGLQHELSRDFRKWFKLPVDISLQAGFSQVNTNVFLNIQPPPPDTNVISTGASYDDQKFILTSQAYTLNMIVSRDLKKVWKPLSVYAGVGMNGEAYRMQLTGNYPLPTPYYSPPYYGKIVVQDFRDPIDVDIKSKPSFRATLGTRLKFRYVQTHADVTFARYFSVNAGIGLIFENLWGKKETD